MREIVERRTGLKLKDLPKKNGKFGGHEVGKIYYCGYWRQTYEVLEVAETSDWRHWTALCKWSDGEVNEHSTRLIPGKDFEVIPA